MMTQEPIKPESKLTNQNQIELKKLDDDNFKNDDDNKNLKAEFAKLLNEKNIDNLIDMVQSYLKNFSKNNINEFYNSIIFLLEWTYTHCKTFLNLVLSEIHNELKLTNLPLLDVENSQQFSEINFKFFDLSLKLYRSISFNELCEKIPSFDSLINSFPDECGKYVINLMIQAHPQDISAFLFKLLLTDIKNIRDYSIISDALMIVFIKNDNSFRMISNFEEEFTTKYRSIFEQFLNNLDSFLLDDRKFSEYYQLYQLSSYQRRTQKMIKRFLNRVFNNFDSLDPFSAPHYIETTNWETLVYLIKSRFRNKIISEDAFYELSYRLIEVSPEIEQRFRSCLRKQGRDAEKKFDNLLPYSKSYSTSYIQTRDLLLEDIRNNNNDNKNNKDIPYYSQNYKFKYYIGKPNQDFSIHFVCEEDGLQDMITRFLPNNKLIAIDAEWLPIFNYQKSSISIIQIAMRNICFIIDLNNFTNKSDRYKALWNEFVEKCFHSQDYLKIGYGIGQDLEMLRQSTLNRQIRFVNVLDLTKSSRNFIEFLAQQPPNSRNRYFKQAILRCKEATEASIDNNNHNEFYNNVSDSFNKNNSTSSSSSLQGLSLLTYVLFGYALDKSERQSDWTRRPLRSAQLLYAALDSYCLLDIYERMQKIATHFNFPDFQTFSMHIKTFNENGSA